MKMGGTVQPWAAASHRGMAELQTCGLLGGQLSSTFITSPSVPPFEPAVPRLGTFLMYGNFY